ncbi:hypothetical protein KVV02_007339 [Mortierella alpina]|uniref:Uncharacterized protein n=1 Tax=Mortierella alpina TaxID=64518 RepID=A0A9P8A0D4_MORAP|nr:hypothetical protein KVV02_007339 [Mortierella alpina]
MEGSVDGDKDHGIASESASGPSTVTTRRSTRKRKLPLEGSDNQDATPEANRNGKQSLRGQDLQMPLEKSHLRSDALAKSTKTTYEHYQRLWVEWCTRKGYTDYLVTESKFQVYMSENLAEDTDEEKDIHPIRIKRKKMEEVRNSDTFNKNDYLPSVELVEAHVKALCDLYEIQKAKVRVAMAGGPGPSADSRRQGSTQAIQAQTKRNREISSC